MSALSNRMRVGAMRGLSYRCPACGGGYIYKKFLVITDSCPSCQHKLSVYPCDDAPVYITIFLVCSTLVPLFLWVSAIWDTSYWLTILLFTPMLLVLTVLLMPRVKGVVLGVLWALAMKK